MYLYLINILSRQKILNCSKLRNEQNWLCKPKVSSYSKCTCRLNDIYWFEQKSLSCGFHAFSILEEYDFRLNVKCFITVEGNLELREKCT